jgi:S-DNA-T family DNA segregation ATPase FtsK/SpoIIIE
MAHKSSKKKKQKSKVLQTEGRTKKIFGISLLVLSLYLLISFISYFFTWQDDQDQELAG